MTDVLAVKAADQALVVGRTYHSGADGFAIFAGRSTWGEGFDTVGKWDYVAVKNGGCCLDGMNKAGLSFQLICSKKGVEKPEIIGKIDFQVESIGDFLLSRFQNCKEIQDWTGINKQLRFGLPHQSFIREQGCTCISRVTATLNDTTGKCVLIRFNLQGRIECIENEVKLATDNVNHQWNVTNLGRYLNLTPFTIYNFHSFGDWKILPYGHGTGMMGLPGDYRPQSRFVKAAYLRQWSQPAQSSQAAINLLQHIFNQIQICKNAITVQKAPFYTKWQVFKDLTNKQYCFKSYEEQSLKKIDLGQLKFDNQVPIQLCNEPFSLIDETDIFLKHAQN